MSTEVGATAADAAPALPDDISLEDARGIIDSWENPDQHMLMEGQEPEAPEEVEPPKQKSSSKEQDAPPPEEAKSEEAEEDAPEDPTRELPRSWAKDKSELWAKLDPDLQDYLLEQDSQASKAVRRSQNEAAERQKALDAKLAEVEQVRKEYESKVPTLVRQLEDSLQAEFGDVRTLQDVTKLQAEDPFRFQQWQIHQMRISAAKAEQDAVDKRTAQETQSNWAKHVTNESEEFAKTLSEADRGKLKEWNDKAPDFLVDKGFSREQLNELANGKLISIYDHRIQSLILDGMKYQAVQNAPKAVAQKPVPTVSKPGTYRAVAADAELTRLSNRLEQSGSEEDAWALLQAKMKSSSRR